MNLKLAALTVAASLLPFAASAADESAPATGYQLKNRSSFDAPETSRAPFWPIGWSKRPHKTDVAVVEAPIVPKVLIDPSQFKISSILLGSPSLAVINGRAYGEGEYIRAARAAAGAPAPTAAPGTPAAPQPRVRVQQITDGSVVLQCAEQSITVPFHRPALAAKLPERDLLSEDR